MKTFFKKWGNRIQYIWYNKFHLLSYLFTEYKSLNRERVSNFMGAIDRMALVKNNSKTEGNVNHTHIEEQVSFRLHLVQAKSPECISSGRCVRCGCLTPDKFYESEDCEYGCYPHLLSESEWKSWKVFAESYTKADINEVTAPE